MLLLPFEDLEVGLEELILGSATTSSADEEGSFALDLKRRESDRDRRDRKGRVEMSERVEI